MALAGVNASDRGEGNSMMSTAEALAAARKLVENVVLKKKGAAVARSCCFGLIAGHGGEIEQWRRDAERYRMLRDNTTGSVWECFRICAEEIADCNKVLDGAYGDEYLTNKAKP